MLNKELQEYWNEEIYIKERKIWGDECSYAAKFFSEYLKKNQLRVGTLLDMGCGYGRDSWYFKQGGLEVEGIDFAEEGIKIAQEQYQDIKFRVGDVQNLPYDDNMFDYCFCNYVIHWFNEEERKRTIEEAYRIVKEKGTVAFAIPMFGVDEVGVIFEYKDVIYTEEMAVKEFSKFSKMSSYKLEEEHTHGGKHTHKIYMIILQK